MLEQEYADMTKRQLDGLVESIKKYKKEIEKLKQENEDLKQMLNTSNSGELEQLSLNI